MKRLFLALHLSVEARRSLANAVAWMLECKGKLSVVSPENYHVTLKFLGPTDEAAIPKILKALQSETKNIPPFDFRLDQWGVFPSEWHPAVFWAGVEPAEVLASIAGQCELLMETFGFFPEKRIFHSHVTLARAGREHAPTEFLKRWKEMDRLSGVVQTRVKKITLYESTTDPGGAVYKALGIAELGS